MKADDLCARCGHMRAWHVGSAEHPTSCSGDAGPGTCDCRAFQLVYGHYPVRFVSREELKKLYPPKKPD